MRHSRMSLRPGTSHSAILNSDAHLSSLGLLSRKTGGMEAATVWRASPQIFRKAESDYLKTFSTRQPWQTSSLPSTNTTNTIYQKSTGAESGQLIQFLETEKTQMCLQHPADTRKRKHFKDARRNDTKMKMIINHGHCPSCNNLKTLKFSTQEA